MLLFVGFWVGDGSFLEMAGRSAMMVQVAFADFRFFKSLLKELFIDAGVELLCATAWYRLASGLWRHRAPAAHFLFKQTA